MDALGNNLCVLLVKYIVQSLILRSHGNPSH
jgi:hypothetical protein